MNETFVHRVYTQIGCPILPLFLCLAHTHLLVRTGLVNFLGEGGHDQAHDQPLTSKLLMRATIPRGKKQQNMANNESPR